MYVHTHTCMNVCAETLCTLWRRPGRVLESPPLTKRDTRLPAQNHTVRGPELIENLYEYAPSTRPETCDWL